MTLAQDSKHLPDWEKQLAARLPLFGHRNWIVITDAAYPAQSNEGIEIVLADGDPLEVVRRVLEKIAACKHIRANIYTDLEIGFVQESDAPGILEYRQQLDALLEQSHVKQLLHDQIIAKLAECGRNFRILIVKANLVIPYTSVFLELDCGYWNADAETRLRQAMTVRA